jgi:Flp pilus assembly protein TadD
VLVDLQWDNVAEAPEISGGSPAAELALAEMTAAMPGRSGQAIESYAQLSRDYPTVWEVEAGWGETLLVHGKTGEAAPHFARAVDLGCHDVSVFLEYSQALMAERRNDEAVSVLKTAAKLSPAPGDVHRQLGMALALTANYPEALREFAQAGNVAASDAARFFYTFAYAYYRTGNKPLARETLAKAAACAKTAPEKTMIDGLRESLDSDAARPADPSFDASQVPHAEPGPPRLVRRNPAPEGSLPAPPKPEPLKVAEGALQAVDCNAKLLRLLVADSAVVLRILDPEKVVVKSADGGSLELTCGPQKAKRVRVEFDAPPGLSPGIAGVVRSIEFP